MEPKVAQQIPLPNVQECAVHSCRQEDPLPVVRQKQSYDVLIRPTVEEQPDQASCLLSVGADGFLSEQFEEFLEERE